MLKTVYGHSYVTFFFDCYYLFTQKDIGLHIFMPSFSYLQLCVKSCVFSDQVIIAALFVASVMKKLDEEEKSEIEKQSTKLASNEEWIYNQEHYEDILDEDENATLAPPDRSQLEEARQFRIKEDKMFEILRELICYVIFTIVVIMISYSNREKLAFRQNRNVEELFRVRVRETQPWKRGDAVDNVVSWKKANKEEKGGKKETLYQNVSNSRPCGIFIVCLMYYLLP